MEKSIMWMMIGVGSVIGGFVPSIFGASYLSLWGIVGSTLGAIAGLYLYRRFDL